jgi:histidinol dehydrogenase
MRTIRALAIAARRIRRFHQKEIRPSWSLKEAGLNVGLERRPLERVGIYIPGGRATYPSTVLMTAVPARLAGVKEIVMVSPCPRGEVSAVTLVAADMAGVDRIFKVGGAQAIAALAFGTESVPRVDKIVGPGNRFVTEAKRQVMGKVGIDSLAGPTELVILADRGANPAWIAADLISQAEHDPDARTLVITDSASLRRRVEGELKLQLRKTPRRDIVQASLKRHGEIISVPSLDKACDRINQIAPEHLEVQVASPRRLLKKILHAGAIFLGPYSPVALGDYVAGSNHVLPTAGTARFSSPLGLNDFQKWSAVIEATKKGLKRLAPVIKDLAEVEGLPAHGESVAIRLRR